MSDLSSSYVINALAEVITGGSQNDPTPSIGIYRSGYKIEKFFAELGQRFEIGGRSRVPATVEHLQLLSFDKEADKIFKRIILHVADPRTYINEPAKTQAVHDYLNRVLEAEGYLLSIANGKAQLDKQGDPGLTVSAFASKVTKLDFDTVQHEIQRALASVETDPEDAVTAACSIVEAVCRSVLIELHLDLPAKKDIDGLMRAVQEPLGLSAGKAGVPSEIQQDVRQILSGLTSVAKGVGALRTHGGDAHGREKGFKRIDPRIARLALHSASSLSLFLIETWERKERRALRNHPEVA
ncbi:abortive infection family protein [Aestuariivirga litoralis]|uniref:abortive infection family protein n=1 Tax=Aestuariivirga litoralis TaxID=2650924 RepID=UPI0018C500CC|nr:abortive infection family protein [Aestuariivirga litoralis]MBG1233983.1 abortive infection family protein [Aestuariivirga litoralis]